MPDDALHPEAEYFDQTDIGQLQRAALAAGKKYVVLIVFDGMDWQTTQAAAIYKSGKVGYAEGRGTGCAFRITAERKPTMASSFRRRPATPAPSTSTRRRSAARRACSAGTTHATGGPLVDAR